LLLAKVSKNILPENAELKRKGVKYTNVQIYLFKIFVPKSN
jgi:hypothetical protein